MRIEHAPSHPFAPQLVLETRDIISNKEMKQRSPKKKIPIRSHVCSFATASLWRVEDWDEA